MSPAPSRELELRRSLVQILHMTHGWAAAETVEAFERVSALAENSGDLGRLIFSITQSSFHACVAGDFSTSVALADEALELAVREGNPAALALLHMMQLVVRFHLGDLAGVEDHFTAGLQFF